MRSICFRNIESRLNDFSIIPFYLLKNGYINIKYMRQHVKDFMQNDFFICAPPRMIQTLKNSLIKSEISKNRIHSEEFDF